MEKTDTFYDFLQEAVSGTVRLTQLQDVKEQRIIVLGNNFLAKVEKLINAIKESNPELECTFIGHESHIQFSSQKWPEYKSILWEGAYSLGIVDKLRENKALDGSQAFLFVSANPINLRDLNILEIALELEKLDICTYVYDYGMEELYKYHNVSLLKKGLEVYVGINDFIEQALEYESEGA